jgi:hypothetical protein
MIAVENIFNQLQGKYESDEITFAKCDVAANTIPVDVYRSPTIKLFPITGKKNRSLDYFGDRTKESEYQKFIEDETGWQPRAPAK